MGLASWLDDAFVVGVDGFRRCSWGVDAVDRFIQGTYGGEKESTL